MQVNAEAEDGEGAFDWSRLREQAGLTAGAMVLVLVFGQQGWLLWHRGRMVCAWALSSARPRACILRRIVD